ncbi:hypothetical protein M405DRAFT_875443 [Rhizopogon salebrosus TDB-379]|nr:hypothetical protein M405DRAFT_875443 [Rhizopogon salebrosus TDB-379]
MSVFACVGTALNVHRCIKAVQLQRGRGIRFDDSFMYFMLTESLIYFCGSFSLSFTSTVLRFEESSGFMNRPLNGLALPITGLLSARLILNLREWSDRTLVQVSACKRTGQVERHQLPSVIRLSFHAATVGHLMSSGEFGNDHLDYVYDGSGR